MMSIEQPKFSFFGKEGEEKIAEDQQGRQEVFADEDEIVHCQYCQDGGPCVYCDRGREVIANLRPRTTGKN